MMRAPLIALVGDYSPEVVAHRAIPFALERARQESAAAIDWQWVPTRNIRVATHDLAAFAAIWAVPASPYENMSGVLDAIRFVRETRRPFLGTCGGFQHALIEFARNVAGIAGADHAETNPSGSSLVVAPLACSLMEQTGEIRFAPGSRLREIYNRDTVREDYHCRYGLNAAHRATLADAGLQFSACDADGEVRAAELSPTTHPFFIGTLFQPERVALRGETPPLVKVFIQTCLAGERRREQGEGGSLAR